MADKPDEHPGQTLTAVTEKVNSVAIFKLANEIRVTNEAIKEVDIG